MVRENLPPSFRNPAYNLVRYIIDCTEIFLETPQNLQVRTDTWSDYKHHNTAKYLVSITPSGMINYVSKGWGGRTSDKFITVNSVRTHDLSCVFFNASPDSILLVSHSHGGSTTGSQ